MKEWLAFRQNCSKPHKFTMGADYSYTMLLFLLSVPHGIIGPLCCVNRNFPNAKSPLTRPWFFFSPNLPKTPELLQFFSDGI